MRSRRVRTRATPLAVTRLEDRTVPHGKFEVGVVSLAPQHFLTGPNYGPLTGPQAGDYQALAAQALVAQAPAMGLTVADVADPVVSSAYSDGPGETSHVYYKQKFNGLPVVGASIGVHVGGDGSIRTVNGGFVPGLGAQNVGVPGKPTLTWAEAVDVAGRHLGLTATTPPTVASSTGGIERAAVVTAPGVSVDPVPVHLAYVNTPGGVRLAWQMVVNAPGAPWYDAAVDAQTGDLLFVANWSHEFGTYNVQALPDESPLDGPGPLVDSRQILVNPADSKASPFGWHDTNGQPGAEFTDTRGNNVHAQEDRDDNDFGGRRPSGGPGLLFNNPVNFNQDPDTYVDAIVANLFYQNNVAHDLHFQYGFTEAAGNFQQRNYTGQGKGGDPVQADSLDGSGLGFANNAFMATPPDGTSPRMAMFRFVSNPFTGVPVNPNRASDFDNGIVQHEYGHGVSTRLTGGPADTSTLNSVQAGGMGEGWSDWWALMFTQRPTDSKNDRFSTGNYVLGLPATGGGGRRNPYSFDLAANPITFDAYNTDRSFFGEPEVHNTGEIWASALWDLNWLLVDQFGFDADLSTGYTGGKGPGRTPGGAGNKLALKLVTDALKLQPSNPSFIQARDAILAADLALTGGQAHRAIWTAFARRGLGRAAASADSTRITITTAYDLPAEAKNPGIVGQAPFGVTVGGGAPGAITVSFSEPMDTTSFDPAQDIGTFTGPDGGDLRGAVTGFSWSGDKKALTVNFNPPAQPQGRYALAFLPTIQALDDGSKIDQNLDGLVGSTGAASDVYTAHFGYDAAPLTATAAPVNAALESGSDSILVTFSEPVAASSVGVNDLELSQGTVAAFVQTGPNTVRYDVTGLTAGVVYYSVKLAAVTDAYGFANTAKNGSLPVVTAGPEIDVAPLPTPLAQLGAAGWQAYQGGMTTWAAAAGDADTFTFNLDAGTKVQAVVDQAPTLRAKVTLFGPLGTELGTASADAPGRAAATGAIEARVSGAYRLKVEALTTVAGVPPATVGTTGAYRVRLLIGAAAEGEGLGGPANPRTAPEPLPASRFVDYGGGASGASVAGEVSAADGSDHYAVDLAAGDTLTVGLSRQAGGGAAVQIIDPAGAVVGAPNGPANFDQAASVTAPAPGTYLVRVASPAALAAEPYLLSVVKNGAVEQEPNNSRPTGQPVNLPGVVRGAIATPGDEDFYTIQVPANGDLTVSTATPGGGPGEYPNPLDPVIELFRGPSSLVVNDNGAGDGKNGLIRLSGLPAGTYSVRVTGRLGSTGEYLIRTDTDPNPGPVGVGQPAPYAVAEGGVLTLAATAAEPDGGPLTYGWDLNDDGDFTDVTSATPTVDVPWAILQTFGVDNGPGLKAIFTRVSDGNTQATSTGVVLTVTNTAPTGTPTLGGTIGESSDVVVGFLSVNDPSAADTAAGLRYSYDFNSDGTWEVGNGSDYGGSVPDPTTTVPPQLVADGTGAGNPFSVTVRVFDRDQGFSDQTISFTVVNTPPLAEFADPAEPFRENQDGRTLTVAGLRDSAADTAAGFRYSFDFDGDGVFDLGDGTAAGSVPITANTVPVDTKYFPEGPVPGDVPLRVRARIFDKDGGQTDFSRDLTILNAPPTAAGIETATAGVTEGGTAEVTVVGATDLSQEDRDAGLRYSYDFDGNGQFDDGFGDGTYAGSIPNPQVAVPPARLDDGSPAGVTVRARVVDRDEGATDYTAVIPVANVAPTADVAVTKDGGTDLTVGAPLTVTFANQRDPSAADTAAGFRYSIDVNNDGDFDDQELGEVSGVVTPAVTFPGFDTPTSKDAPVTVRLRIADKDGGFTDYTRELSIRNVAPTAAAAAIAPVPEGGSATVRINATHPSGVATGAGFRYAYDFDGDGKFEVGGTTYATASKLAAVPVPTNLLTDGGTTRTVGVRVFELNGLSTDLAVPVEVRNVAPTATLVGPAGRVEVRTPATFTLVTPADPSPQDTAAGFTYSFDFNNDGDFVDAGEVAGSRTPTAATQFGLTGPYTVRVRVTDKDGGFTDYTQTVTVGTLTKTFYAAGVGPDNLPVARLYDGNGTVIYAGQVFGSEVTSGVRVSTADVTGDGTPDLVAATGPGVPAEIAVVDGRSKNVVFRIRPFGTFTGGAYVATGDTDGDGRAEIAVSPDEGGGPRIVLYSGAGFRQIASFFGIADPAFRGGARVAMADVNGDGLSDLLVAAGVGGGPRVAGYDGRTIATSRDKLFNDFFAYDPALRNGVYLSGGDLNGDGRAEVVVGAGPGGGPQVKAFDGAALLQGVSLERANFFAQDIANRNGVRVTVADVDADGRADIVTGDASGPGLNVFRGRSIQASGRPTDEFELFPFDTLMNGVFVG